MVPLNMMFLNNNFLVSVEAPNAVKVMAIKVECIVLVDNIFFFLFFIVYFSKKHTQERIKLEHEL